MKRLLLLTTVLALVAGCAGLPPSGDIVTGSGKLVSRTFDLRGFSRIDGNSAAQVEVTRGEGFSVEVEVDDNLASRLDVAAQGDTLRIRLQDSRYRNPTLRARVTMPRLSGVTLDGASTLRGNLAGEDLVVKLNGAGKATLTGTAGRVTIDANGGSQAMLGDLAAGNVDLVADGGSRIEIRCAGAVTGRANGGAAVTVRGSPTSVNVRTDGGATVTTR